MHSWKSAALTSAFVIVVAGAVVTAVVHAQGREQTSAARVFDWISGGSQIGVTVKDVESDDSKQAVIGVIIEDVQSDSPAEKAGCKAGDTIIEFDGERVRSVTQFRRLVQETPAGRKVQAVLSRNGQHVTVSVTPERSSSFWSGEGIDRWEDGARGRMFRTPPAPPAPPSSPAPPHDPIPPAFELPEIPDFDFAFAGRGGRVGISVEGLTPQLEGYFGVKDGVLVRSVEDGSAAAKAGLKAGDVITAVNGSTVSDPSDLRHAVNRVGDGAEFSIDIVRDKKAQTLKGKMEPRRDRVRSRTAV